MKIRQNMGNKQQNLYRNDVFLNNEGKKRGLLFLEILI